MTESYHTTGRKSTHGFVYLIKSDSGHYKIGKSKSPKARAGEFSLQLPFKIAVVDVIECEDYTATERLLHSALRKYHVNGEWFLLPPGTEHILRGVVFMLAVGGVVSAENVTIWDTRDTEEMSDLGTLLTNLSRNWEARQ